MRSDPGVGTFDFDRQKSGINSEAVTKSVPRGFLKVTLLEKGVKFSFVSIYFEKVFIFKFPSDCKTRLKSNYAMKVREFFYGSLFRPVEQML